MKHLTDEQLSAYLDGAFRGREAETFSRHLADCQPCREALAEMAAQDQSLGPVLRHDPGDPYFESFAARVDDRIRAAGLAGAPTRVDRFDLGRLFRSPRALAWVGAVTVVVVGGGLALMTSREGLPPTLRDGKVDRLMERRSEQAPASPAAPPSAAAPSNQAAGPPAEQEELPATDKSRALARDQDAELKSPASAPVDERAASPTRAMEIRRTESGEDVPVRRKDSPVSAPSPAAGSAEVSVTGETQVRKKTMAEPMQKQAAPPPASTSLDAGAPRPEAAQSSAFAAPPPAAAKLQSTAEGEVRVCGAVRDAQGRPIAGAQVVASDLGRSVSADREGHFCLSLPPGEHPVSVMAVGYATIRRTLRTGDPEASLTLVAVPVLEGDGVSTPKPSLTMQGAPVNRMRELSVAPFAGLPDSLRGAVREAQRLETEAAAHRSASQFDAAAGAWERSLKSLAGGPLEVEARRHLSTARYRAWELSPTAGRARAATEALNAYVTRAPAGPDRAQAVLWLDKVKP